MPIAHNYPEQIELNYVVECEHIENDGSLCIEEATRAVGSLKRMIFLCDTHRRIGEYRLSVVNINITYEKGAIKFEEFNRASTKANHTQTVASSVRLR